MTTSTSAVASGSGAPPVAKADAVRVRAGRLADVDVLANDRDPDGDLEPGSLRIARAPGQGTARVVRGRVSYRSGPEANGTDKFSYAIEDRTGLCATGLVRVTIG